MSFLDDLLGKTSSKASNAAAADTWQKQQQATGALTSYGDQYRNDYSNLSQQYQPYQQAGNQSLQMLLSGLGLNGGGGQQSFTSAYRGLPGYQNGLEAGGQTVAANANAGNMLQSGKTLQALQRYGSDYEDQRSGDYLTRLMGMQGQGLQATNQSVATQGQGLQGQMQTRQGAYGGQMQSAGTIGQGMVEGAKAETGAMTNLFNQAVGLAGVGMGSGWGKTPMPTTRQSGWGAPVNPAQNVYQNPWNSWGR